MNNSLYTQKFSFGKWCFLFIGGIILFLIVYSLATIPELYIVNNWISGTLSLISGLLLLLMYRWLVGSYENRKIEELSMQKCLRHTGIGLLWGVLMMAAIIGIFFEIKEIKRQSRAVKVTHPPADRRQLHGRRKLTSSQATKGSDFTSKASGIW